MVQWAHICASYGTVRFFKRDHCPFYLRWNLAWNLTTPAHPLTCLAQQLLNMLTLVPSITITESGGPENVPPGGPRVEEYTNYDRQPKSNYDKL